MPEQPEPLNYPVTNPDGSVSPAYPIDPRLDALRSRLATLEQAHANLNIAFHRRAAEYESRLDNAQAEIKDLKTLATYHAERIEGLERFLGPKPPY